MKPTEQATPGYNHKIPEMIMTPDKVETRIGTLEFFDGMPRFDKTWRPGEIELMQ